MKLLRSAAYSRIVVASLLVAAFPLRGSLAACEERWASSIEGVYALQEWHTEAGVLRPPVIDRRFVLKDGAVMTMVQNYADEAKKTTLALFGVFLTEGCKFSYRYSNRSFFTQTPTGTTVSRALPWEGMRVFAVSSEDDNTILRTADGEREFNFSPTGLRYSESGKLLRVWSKVLKE